ncbi:MAG: aldolase/citrate lyase family protein [Pseudomonadota bacterium]
MLQGISTTAVTPMARVPWNDPAIIMKSLDAGCYGIICPMINTREECERFVRACRYAPKGYRSSGPIRASLYGGPDYAEKANETILTFAMIETKEAVGNLDAILSTPELDAIYVGPSDLSLTYGFGPGLDRAEPEMEKIIGTIIAACKKHNIKAGIHNRQPGLRQEGVRHGLQLRHPDGRRAAAQHGRQPGREGNARRRRRQERRAGQGLGLLRRVTASAPHPNLPPQGGREADLAA